VPEETKSKRAQKYPVGGSSAEIRKVTDLTSRWKGRHLGKTSRSLTGTALKMPSSSKIKAVAQSRPLGGRRKVLKPPTEAGIKTLAGRSGARIQCICHLSRKVWREAKFLNQKGAAPVGKILNDGLSKRPETCVSDTIKRIPHHQEVII